MYQTMTKQSKQKYLVVDDQELILHATINQLRQHYPEAEIFQAQTIQQALNQIATIQLDLIVVDLVMPETTGESAHAETGLQLLKTVMRQYPTLNIVVQTANPRALVRLKAGISNHEGGFTVADKSLSMKEMLTRVEWALKGLQCTPKEMRLGLEVKPEWLELLQLACDKGLQDTAIAKQMHVSERTIRNYWSKIYDVLEVYPNNGQNLRILTKNRAKEEGLID